MLLRLSIVLVSLPALTQSMELCEYLHSIGQPWGAPGCMRGNSVGIGGMSTMGHIPAGRFPAPGPAPIRFTARPHPVLVTPAPRSYKTSPSPLGQIIRNVERIQITNKKTISALLPAGAKPTCARLKQTNCESDSGCPSGVGCTQSDTGKPCCFRAAGSEPRFRKLQPSARVSLSTTTAPSMTCPVLKSACPAKGTMCSSANDCSNPTTPLCCDSGCGYSICVRGLVDDSKYSVVDAASVRSECPALSEIKCSRKGGISWCSNDGHCQIPGSTSVARYCCPTQCDYNVCVSKEGGQTIIG